MNKYVPTIVLVLDYKNDTETIYKTNTNQFFKICVPHDSNYESDCYECELTDIIKDMTDIYDDDYDEPFTYDVQFVDKDFYDVLSRKLTHISLLEDEKGYKYARDTLTIAYRK